MTSVILDRIGELGLAMKRARERVAELRKERDSIMGRLESGSELDEQLWNAAMVLDSRLDEAIEHHRLLFEKSKAIAEFL